MDTRLLGSNMQQSQVKALRLCPTLTEEGDTSNSADSHSKDAQRENTMYSNTGGHPLDIGLIIKSGMPVKEV